MELINSTGWNDPWIRKAVRFCCEAVDYPPDGLRRVRATLAHKGSYSGMAFMQERKIAVKLNPLNLYPVTDPPTRGLPELVLADPIEVFILVASHEVAHLERWERVSKEMRRRGERDTRLEQSVERVARIALGEFRKDRAAALTRWGDSGPGPVPPASVWRRVCPRCGKTWRATARRPKPAACSKCFSNFDTADAAGALLIVERVPYVA